MSVEDGLADGVELAGRDTHPHAVALGLERLGNDAPDTAHRFQLFGGVDRQAGLLCVVDELWAVY